MFRAESGCARWPLVDASTQLASCYDPDRHTPQREPWDGHPIELGDAWVMRKGDKVARCILVTHPLGLELRLMTPRSAALSGVPLGRGDSQHARSVGRRRCSRRAGDEWTRFTRRRVRGFFGS